MMAGLRADPHAATEAYWMTMLGPSSDAVRGRLMRDLRATPGPAIVGPMEDLITPANQAPVVLHAQLPELPVRKVATGHWVQLDDPEGVNRLLDEFLASVASSSSAAAST